LSFSITNADTERIARSLAFGEVLRRGVVAVGEKLDRNDIDGALKMLTVLVKYARKRDLTNDAKSFGAAAKRAEGVRLQ